MPRKLKIALLALLTTAVLTLAGATAWLYFNEEKIYALVLDALNENQVGHTEVERIDVSPFQNFPYVSLGLHGVHFYGDKAKSEPPIYEVADVYMGFDLMPMLHGKYTIKKLKVRNGTLRLVRFENGDLNLLLAKAAATESQADDTPLHLDLRKMLVTDFRIEERNLQGNKFFNLLLRDAEASFSSIGNEINMAYRGDMVLHEYSSEGITYFRDKNVGLETRFTYHGNRDFLHIAPGTLKLDYGSLDFEGSIDFARDAWLDITLKGQKKNFDVFISFAPNEIAEKLANFRNEGDIFFEGHIRGPSVNQSPAIDIHLGCRNTFFFHKDKSHALRDVQFNGRFHTGAKNNLETAELELTELYGVPEEGVFRGSFKAVNFTNPTVRFDFHAQADLAYFQTFYDPEWLEEAGGKVTIDITLNEFVDQDSLIHAASRMDDGTLSRIELDQVWLKLRDYPHRISNLNGRVVLDGDNLLLERLTANVGKSSGLLSATLKNLNALAHHQSAPLELTLHVESPRIDLPDLLPTDLVNPEDPFTSEVITNLTADFDLSTTVDAVYNYNHVPSIEIDIRKFTAQLEGYNQPLRRIAGRIKTGDNQIDIDDLTVEIGENDLHMSLLIDQPAAFFTRKKGLESHFHTKVLARRIAFNELLHYRGKPMLDEEIQEQLGEERISNLHFECDGYIEPASISPHGLRGYCNIEKLTVQINNLPKLQGARGRFRADTTGCLYIEDFYAKLGRSDYFADLQLLHLLDTIASKREVYGKVGGKRWDFDEYFAKAAPTKPISHPHAPTPAALAHEPELNVFALPFPKLDLVLEIDELINEKYKLNNLYAHFKANPNHQVWIDTLRFRAAGGQVGISGDLDGSNKRDLLLTARLELDRVDLDQLFVKFDNFGQDYLVSEQVHGRVSGRISTQAHLYPDLTPMLDKTEAHMELRIEDGRLENFAPMQAMSDFMGNRNLNNIRFGELENSFDFKNGSLTIPRMKIASTLGYIHLSGRQDVDYKLDYEIEVPLSLVKSAGWNMMKAKLAGGRNGNRQKELAEVEEDIITEQKGLIKKYMTFRVTGTTEAFDVGLGRNRNLAQEDGKRGENRKKD